LEGVGESARRRTSEIASNSFKSRLLSNAFIFEARIFIRSVDLLVGVEHPLRTSVSGSIGSGALPACAANGARLCVMVAQGLNILR
jgi:hypothetical protein